LAFAVQESFTELVTAIDAALGRLAKSGDVLIGVGGVGPWVAPATAAFQQNRQGLLYTPGGGLLGVQANAVAQGLQAGNFGSSTEFGKLSINVAVWVALIAAFLVQLAAYFTGGAAEAGMVPISVSAREAIASILSRLAESVGERFGAKALAGLEKKAIEAAEAAAERRAAEAAAEQTVKTAGKEALDGSGREALARATTRRVTNEIVRQSGEGIAFTVWANVEQQDRHPGVAWNWESTVSMVLALACFWTLTLAGATLMWLPASNRFFLLRRGVPAYPVPAASGADAALEDLGPKDPAFDGPAFDAPALKGELL